MNWKNLRDLREAESNIENRHETMRVNVIQFQGSRKQLCGATEDKASGDRLPYLVLVQELKNAIVTNTGHKYSVASRARARIKRVSAALHAVIERSCISRTRENKKF